MKVPIPSNEEQRLLALQEYNILDTATEDIYDKIVSLAASICEVPISLISLVDRDRQWMKATTGAPGFKESPRDIAFCSYAILNSDLMEVPDATLDERFKDNPSVINEPKVRFYAGVPLKNPEGFNLGTLCVIDQKPRELRGEQKEKLQTLSYIIMSLFETKKQIAQSLEKKKVILNDLTKVNNELQLRLNEQKQNNNEINLLSQMNGMLQSCLTFEEAYVVIRKFCQKLFTQAEGRLYLLNNTHDFVELVTSWGDKKNSLEFFTMDDCWALRRGQHHYVSETETDLICKHLQSETTVSPSMCLPLTSQGEAIGLLTLSFPLADNKFVLNTTETQHLLSISMAEQIALALANIKLRLSLRKQSICDPLTGLYNRRYLSEMFKQELLRAMRNNKKLSVIAIDIDYFKQFNDSFGHDAGDLVLKQVSQTLNQHAMPRGYVFRLGGEEFALLYPEGLEASRLFAEKLRQGIESMKLHYAGRNLGKLTISLGVATYPYHGKELEELLTTADHALYQAKENGRNKVVMSRTYEKEKV